MKTLADEVLMTVEHAGLSTVRAVAGHLAADYASVRRAFDELDHTNRARLCRRGRALHLLLADDPTPICVICRREFRPVRKGTRTCSHSCARHLAWQNAEMRERHRESIRRAKNTPDGRRNQIEAARRTAKDPKRSAAISKRNREHWADPQKRMKRLVAIERAWSGNPERTESARQRRLRDWKDPEFRTKTMRAMQTGRRGRFKRAILQLAKDHPEMTNTEIGDLVGRTVVQVAIVLTRARRHGEIGVRPGDNWRVRRRAGMA